MGYKIMGIVTRVRLLGLWLGGGLRIGWSPVRFMRSPVVTVTFGSRSLSSSPPLSAVYYDGCNRCGTINRHSTQRKAEG